MLFHQLDYILFLPLLLLIYWSLPLTARGQTARLGLLGATSLLFYASWSPKTLDVTTGMPIYLFVLIGVIALAWLGGLWLTPQKGRSPSSMKRRVPIILAVLTPLLIFKYWKWIAENIEWVALNAFDTSLSLPRLALALPVGISFFTFQALAYVIDTARVRSVDDQQAVERNPWRFLTFIAFFPQLVAGPIMRRHELLPQLQKLPLLKSGDVSTGIYRILQGLAKKVLVADTLGIAITQPVFDDPSAFTGLELAVALYAYTIQIYYDFSGYTDIAIGSARLFGLELPENFRRPYKATSVAAFWRRWHITLSNWVRDYIYYPLGGSRVKGGEWKVYRNIMLTLITIGIWHGASWNFVVYGTLHGSAVAINRWYRKRTGRRPDDPAPHLWGWIWRWTLTFHFVVIARILFRADDLSTSWAYLVGMSDMPMVMPRFNPMALAVMAVGFAIHFTPERWSDWMERSFRSREPVVWAFGAAVAVMLAHTLGTGEYLDFVYFQF